MMAYISTIKDHILNILEKKGKSKNIQDIEIYLAKKSGVNKDLPEIDINTPIYKIISNNFFVQEK